MVVLIDSVVEANYYVFRKLCFQKSHALTWFRCGIESRGRDISPHSNKNEIKNCHL